VNCTYPNCRQPALWIPVIQIPTIRTIGIERPVLSPLVHDINLMRRNNLDPAMHIRMYEARLQEWKSTQNNLIRTADPTILIGTSLCHLHRVRYNFIDWFGVGEWDALCEAARAHGVVLETGVIITFRPLDWTPEAKYMELDR
jgi:hypothetical protein